MTDSYKIEEDIVLLDHDSVILSESDSSIEILVSDKEVHSNSNDPNITTSPCDSSMFHVAGLDSPRSLSSPSTSQKVFMGTDDESMNVSDDTMEESEEPTRRVQQSFKDEPDTSTPKIEVKETPNTNSKDANEDFLWAYKPLDPYVEIFNEIIRQYPQFKAAVQTTYDRLVEIVRRRPCMLSGNPYPCLGKVKVPVHPLTTSQGYFTVTTVLPSIDVETQTDPQVTIHAVTQTDADQTPTKKDITIHMQTDEIIPARLSTAMDIDQVLYEVTTSNQAQHTNELKLRTIIRERSPIGYPTLSADVNTTWGLTNFQIDPNSGRPCLEVYSGWGNISERAACVTAPRSGCWCCGSLDHLGPHCPDQGRYSTRYCFRCGPGDVTVKECPVHGEEWRTQSPFVPSRGSNVPQNQLPPRRY